MKESLVVLSFAFFLAYPGYAFAGEDMGHEGHMMKESTNPAKTTAASQAIEVGNKICPVSGEKVGEMGDVIKIEHSGKVYNLCCAMCKKDFTKDPEKYSKVAEDEVAKTRK